MRSASTRTVSVAAMAALSIGLLLSGCALRSQRLAEQGIYQEPWPPQHHATWNGAGQGQSYAQATAGNTPIEKLPFHVGVSSVTVEKMARERACTGGPGAGLITEPGPVEVYRMQCDNGKTFMARCELRQCRAM